MCRCLRIPISDMEEEDIGRYFDEARAFIDSAAAGGGAVLVHCHEGKSRSATLVLAYFMKTKVAAMRQDAARILTIVPLVASVRAKTFGWGQCPTKLRASRTDDKFGVMVA